MSKVLEKLKYTKDHEWVDYNDEVASIGITDFAQDALGDIVYLELPSVGDQLEQGSSFGVVESIKSVSDLYAPISGEVLEVNESLTDSPELINADCYKNWLIKIRCKEDDCTTLLSSKDYTDHCDNL